MLFEHRQGDAPIFGLQNGKFVFLQNAGEQMTLILMVVDDKHRRRATYMIRNSRPFRFHNPFHHNNEQLSLNLEQLVKVAKLEYLVDILLRPVEDHAATSLFTVLACEQQHAQRGTVNKINFSQVHAEPCLTVFEQTIDGCAKLLVDLEIKTAFQSNRYTAVGF